jgi:hypothetical protein
MFPMMGGMGMPFGFGMPGQMSGQMTDSVPLADTSE